MTTILVFGLGAAAMYLFDPEQGRRRRAHLRDALAGAKRETDETRKAPVNAAPGRKPPSGAPVTDADVNPTGNGASRYSGVERRKNGGLAYSGAERRAPF